MNSVALDIKDILAAESSLSLVSGSNLFVSSEPPEPDNCVTIYDTSGGLPDLSLKSEEYDRANFQIRVRNNSYVEASNIIYNIRDILQGRYGDSLNGSRYTLIRVIIPPFHLMYDDNNRAILVINFEAQRRKNDV